MVYPSGRIVTYTRDSMGRISGVTTQADAQSPAVTLASNILYREFGPLHTLTYGNGLIFTRHYDQDYRIDVLRLRDGAANLSRREHYYADGINLTGIVETAVAGRDESYWYTATNRLQNAGGPWGALTYYYDGVGNRTYEILDDGSTTTTNVYGYSFDSNRVSGVTQDSTTVRSFTPDAAGNITIDNRAGTNHRYYYNERGRLKQYQVGNQVRANYRYDFFERLNWRETQNMTPAGATHYIQDLSGHLIYEATDTGTPLREYIWIDDMPLAVFAELDTATPQLTYVHPDHLNRPLRMTDESKAIVWDAVYKPFGEVHSITGSATLNLRFPGQYFLLESGLHYNWHRHYDPTLGRYTQPDPIADRVLARTNDRGSTASVFPTHSWSRYTWYRDYVATLGRYPIEFVDGPSRYAYVRSSPAMGIDPTGEFWPQVIGIGIVGIILVQHFQYNSNIPPLPPPPPPPRLPPNSCTPEYPYGVPGVEVRNWTPVPQTPQVVVPRPPDPPGPYLR